MKCLGKDRNGKQCRNYGSPFCKNHQYMNEYTSEIMDTIHEQVKCRETARQKAAPPPMIVLKSNGTN